MKNTLIALALLSATPALALSNAFPATTGVPEFRSDGLYLHFSNPKVEVNERISFVHRDAVHDFCYDIFGAQASGINTKNRHNERFAKFNGHRWNVFHANKEKAVQTVTCGPVDEFSIIGR